MLDFSLFACNCLHFYASTNVVVRGIMYLGCLRVCWCNPVCCYCHSVLKNTWHVFPDFQFSIGAFWVKGERFNFGSKDWDSRSHAEKCTFGLVETISWKLLHWISPNFQHLCILGQRWMLQFWGSEGQMSSAQRVEAYWAWRCASSFNF